MITPVFGRISSKFGYRIHPITKKRTFHNGVDIAVPEGEPIMAPEKGKITEHWDHPKGGNCIAMVGESGRRYGFAHLSIRRFKIGQSIDEGNCIAMSGNTGASTGPHVHFTVKEGGQWVDPCKYFKF